MKKGERHGLNIESGAPICFALTLNRGETKVGKRQRKRACIVRLNSRKNVGKSNDEEDEGESKSRVQNRR